MRPTQILATVLLSSALTAAWPWPPTFGNSGAKEVRNLGDLIVERQNNNDDKTSATPTRATETAESTQTEEDESQTETTTNIRQTAKASNTQEDSASTTTDENDSSTPTGTSKGTGTRDPLSLTITGSGIIRGSTAPTKTGMNGKTTIFDPRLPPGGISMQTPAVTLGAQFYKIGYPVTFGWNYTSLSITPSNIDILAVQSTPNQATYTIASNFTVEPTGKVIWDTANQSVDLSVAMYTLMIYDAAAGPSATPAAGYLGVFKQFTFGMYTPRPYVPLAEYQCTGCKTSGALTTVERQAIGVITGVATLTVLSFTFFAAGFGVL